MKIKVKCTLHAQASNYEESGFRFTVFSAEDMSSCGYTACDTTEVEFDVPNREALVTGAIASYRAEQQRIRAEAEVKSQQIEDAIQKLLSIEDKSGQ